MKIVVPLVLFVGLVPPVLFGQSAKPRVAVAPVAAIGEFDKAENRIVFNTLQSTLSRSYQLVPQDEYRRAEKQAYASLSVEQCTEEYCIRKIQELLQVERLIVLQIIHAGAVTQLTLTLVRDDDKIVRAVTCEGCGVVEQNDRIAALVREVAVADSGRVVRNDAATAEKRAATSRPYRECVKKAEFEDKVLRLEGYITFEDLDEELVKETAKCRERHLN